MLSESELRFSPLARVFIIEESLEFSAGSRDGQPSFTWKDVKGDVKGTYEFVTTDAGAKTVSVELFEQCVHRAISERRRSQGDMWDLCEFVVK